MRLLNVAPPSVLACHCTVGAGEPLAAAVKVALLPARTVRLAGLEVMTGGAVFTVRSAAALVADPITFVNTAR